jgi:hypothetical protein
LTAANELAARAAVDECSRGSGERGLAPRAHSACLVPAGCVAAWIAAQDVRRKLRCRRRVIGYLDRPEVSAQSPQIVRIRDLEVADGLSPCSIRCISEVMRRAFTFPVPPTRRLQLALPQEWPTAIGGAERDHEDV